MGQHAELGQFFLTVVKEDVPRPGPTKKGERADPTSLLVPTQYNQLRAMLWLKTVWDYIGTG